MISIISISERYFDLRQYYLKSVNFKQNLLVTPTFFKQQKLICTPDNFPCSAYPIQYNLIIDKNCFLGFLDAKHCHWTRRPKNWNNWCNSFFNTCKLYKKVCYNLWSKNIIYFNLFFRQSIVANVGKLIFKDEIESLNEESERLKHEQGVEIFIALTHCGFYQDKIIAQRVKNIDIIVGGHTHHYLYNGMFLLNTLNNNSEMS